MIACNFCGGKSQSNYLYLNCKHLACLPCAFLRADFSSQQIQCCRQNTFIDNSAMEAIIRSKRHFKNYQDSCQNGSGTCVDNDKDRQKKRENIQDNYQKKQVVQQQRLQVKAIPQKVSYYQNADKNDEKSIGLDQDENSQLENILIRQVDRIRRHFETQRQLLKQKQQQTLKDLMSTYQQQVKQIQKQKNLSSSIIDKINQTLSKKSSIMRYTANSNSQQNINPNIGTGTCTNLANESNKQLKQSRQKQSYDHILKRLQLNQQRMKQKIQKHLEVLS